MAMWQYSQVLLLLTNLFRTTIHVPPHLFFYTVRRKLNKATSCRVTTKGRQGQKPPYISSISSPQTPVGPLTHLLSMPPTPPGYSLWFGWCVPFCQLCTPLNSSIMYSIHILHLKCCLAELLTWDSHIPHRCFNYSCLYIYTAKKKLF